MKLEENCKISYTTDSNEYYDINFELSFTSEDPQNHFYYQSVKILKLMEKEEFAHFLMLIIFKIIEAFINILIIHL